MAKPRKPRRLLLNVYRGRTGAPPKMQAGELLLEYFSDQDVLAWRAKSGDVQQYHYLWWFELEAQRAALHSQIIRTLRLVPGKALDLSGWGRAMSYKYSNTPLSCIGSLKWVGGRFNYGDDIDSSRFAPFPALYLAEDFETGLREMNGLTREDKRDGLTANELNLCAADGVAWATVRGNVSNIFDLTDSKALKGFAQIVSGFRLSKAVRDAEKRLGATALRLVSNANELHASFMLESWRDYPSLLNTPANSQLFGNLLSVAGFEGVLFSSTRTGNKNLALFPRQFKNSSSFVQVEKPPPNATCCELSAKTYQSLELLS